MREVANNPSNSDFGPVVQGLLHELEQVYILFQFNGAPLVNFHFYKVALMDNVLDRTLGSGTDFWKTTSLLHGSLTTTYGASCSATIRLTSSAV